MGRDLPAIRRRLGLAARASFAASPPPEFHRDGLTRWDFGDLPERVEIASDGMTFSGYPALVDAGSSVSLRIFDAPDIARQQTRAGLRRLFMLQLRQEMEHIERTLPDLDRLCLYYATVGLCDDLKDDLLLAIADRALFDDEPEAPIRSRDEFAARAEAGWRRLADAARQVIEFVAQSLEAYHALDVALSNDFPPLWAESIRDMLDQLSHLIYRGFVVATPFTQLRQLPRYLAGLDVRLKKLAGAGLNRDLQVLAQITALWEQYKRRAARVREEGIHDPALEQFRWMLEELRISQFAQELKAAGPVSVQRAQKQWELITD